MTLRVALVVSIMALISQQAAAQAPASSPVSSPPCYDTAAACHLAAGKALLASNPKEAAKEFYASYRAENRNATYALYALALRLDHRYATSALVFRRVRTRLGTELEAAQHLLSEAQARGDAGAASSASAAISELHGQIENVDSQLSGLESQTARVKLRFASTQEIVVVHKNEGDIKDPFTETILVNAEEDTLIVTYRDGKSIEIEVKAPGGSEQTIVIPAPEGPPPATPPSAAPPLAATRPVDTALPLAEPRHTSRWIGLGALGGAAVSLGVAAIFQIKSSNAWNAAQAPGAGCVDDVCVRGTRGAQLAQDSQDRAHLALGATLAGGALAAAGVVLLLLDRRHTADSTAAHTMLEIAPRNGGVAAFVTGSF